MFLPGLYSPDSHDIESQVARNLQKVASFVRMTSILVPKLTLHLEVGGRKDSQHQPTGRYQIIIIPKMTRGEYSRGGVHKWIALT